MGTFLNSLDNFETNSLTAPPLPAKLQGSKDIGTAFRVVPSTSVDKLGPGSNRRNFRVRRSIYTSNQSIPVQPIRTEGLRNLAGICPVLKSENLAVGWGQENNNEAL